MPVSTAKTHAMMTAVRAIQLVGDAVESARPVTAKAALASRYTTAPAAAARATITARVA